MAAAFLFRLTWFHDFYTERSILMITKHKNDKFFLPCADLHVRHHVGNLRSKAIANALVLQYFFDAIRN